MPFENASKFFDIFNGVKMWLGSKLQTLGSEQQRNGYRSIIECSISHSSLVRAKILFTAFQAYDLCRIFNKNASQVQSCFTPGETIGKNVARSNKN